MFIPRRLVEEKLMQLLAEDVGQGDVTSAAIISANTEVTAEVLAKQAGVVAGLEEAVILSECLGLEAKAKVADGSKIKNKQVLLELRGNAQTILVAERTMLNLLSRMSGIATKTRALTDQLTKSGLKAKIAATRKTDPGLLYFDKKAVVVGGGDPHRLHLEDMILIKDNHLAIVGSVEQAIKKAKDAGSFTKKIEVEVSTPEDAMIASNAGADIVMLDNFTPKQAKSTLEALRKAGFNRVLVEVSGGITSENIMDYAKANADIISIGELTHSVKALNTSLEITKK